MTTEFYPDIIFDIFQSRKSIRDFSDQLIEREKIEAIVSSVQFAPYADTIGLSLSDTRKTFIIPPESKYRSLFDKEMRRMIRRKVPFLWLVSLFDSDVRPFYQYSKNFAKHGVPALYQNTYWILIAERRGYPPVAKQSIAHALQNIWLAATAFGFGFQMLSASNALRKSNKIMETLNLTAHEYEIDGCLIGIKK